MISLKNISWVANGKVVSSTTPFFMLLRYLYSFCFSVGNDIKTGINDVTNIEKVFIKKNPYAIII